MAPLKFAKKEASWIELKTCSLHKRYKFQLAYCILFAYFIALDPRGPYIQASSVYAAVHAQNQIQNSKNQKKQIWKKFQN